MDISQLAKRPKLELLEISDQDIVEAYGDSVSFWIIDHMDISTYFSFYRLQQNEDGELLNSLLRKIILKEDGSPALGADEVLPTDLTLAVLVKINDYLGKSKTIASTPKTGEQQN